VEIHKQVTVLVLLTSLFCVGVLEFMYMCTHIAEIFFVSLPSH